MMKGWETVTLESVCTKVTDGTHDTPEVIESGFPLIKGKDISKGFIDFENCDHVSEAEHFAIIKRSHPEKGDILFSNIGSVGDCVFINTDRAFSIKNVALFKPDPEKVLPRFLYYVVSGEKFTGEILAKKSGSAQPFISLGALRSQKISIPALPIQQKIAGILAAYDDLIENNLKRIKLLEEMAQITYEEWFVRLRFPGHESTPINPETSLPDGWEELPASKTIGINPKTKPIANLEAPYVPMSSLSESSMIIDTIESRIPSGGAKFKNGDTLFARITPCLENGKTGFVNFMDNDATIATGSTEYIVLRETERVNRYFIYCLARSEYFRENSIKSMVGSDGRQRVNSKIYDQLLLKIPPAKVMKAFESKAHPIFSCIKTLVTENQHLREARDILLPRLMTGVIDVESYDPAQLLKEAA
jgi:type I restriction enzyme S subunit